MVFHVGAARMRGASHRKAHTPCQDAARAVLGWSDGAQGRRAPSRDIVVAAVADGGGSRPMSHIGARLTVSLATAAMRARWTAAALQAASEADLDAFWQAVVEDCRVALQHEAAARELKRAGRGDADALACTFIAFMATPDRLAVAQIGDGFVVTGRRSNAAGVGQKGAGEPAAGRFGMDYRIVFQNREVEEAGQVVWLTASNWRDDLRTALLDEPVDFVLASTDGMDRAVLNLDSQPTLPHTPYFDQLCRGLSETVAETAVGGAETSDGLSAYLTRVLAVPKLDAVTDDDKAMAVAIRTMSGML